VLPINGYRLAVAFHDRILISNPVITADVTSVDMSQYFPGHPQYYLNYFIAVQSLYGEEMIPANYSLPIMTSKLIELIMQHENCNDNLMWWNNESIVVLCSVQCMCISACVYIFLCMHLWVYREKISHNLYSSTV